MKRQYFAFLRAINVGGRNVKMDALAEIFRELGFKGVQTYIASGNVVFESDNDDVKQLEVVIEEGLQTALGFEVPAFIRTGRELAEIAGYQAFPPEVIAEKSVQYVTFLRAEPPDDRKKELVSRSTEIDIFHVYQNQVFWLRHRQLGDSKFTNADIEKTLAVSATRRNMNTVRKMAAKFLG